MKKYIVRNINGLKIAINTHNNDCFEINDIVFDILDGKCNHCDYISLIALKYNVHEQDIIKIEKDIMDAFGGSSKIKN